MTGYTTPNLLQAIHMSFSSGALVQVYQPSLTNFVIWRFQAFVLKAIF